MSESPRSGPVSRNASFWSSRAALCSPLLACARRSRLHLKNVVEDARIVRSGAFGRSVQPFSTRSKFLPARQRSVDVPGGRAGIGALLRRSPHILSLFREALRLSRLGIVWHDPSTPHRLSSVAPRIRSEGRIAQASLDECEAAEPFLQGSRSATTSKTAIGHTRGPALGSADPSREDLGSVLPDGGFDSHAVLSKPERTTRLGTALL